MARVALVTHEGAAHIPAYLNALRDLDSVSEACVVDEDGAVFDQARQVIGDKLTDTYQSVTEMLRSHDPCLLYTSPSPRD